MKPFIFLLITASALAQKPVPDTAWVLTFADEFDGKDLDLTRWSPHDPLRTVYAAESTTVSNGQLHLGRGAAVSTYGLFSQTYGKFEIRCRAARNTRKTGIRLLPVPLAPLPSVDVVEVDGAAPSKLLFGNHWGTEQTERSYGDSFDGPELSAGFHVIALEWDEQKIVWFIDGQDRFRSADGIPRQRMFLVIDLEGDIDYVRVYSRPQG
jgi:beta-glucanase (GH16 family)